MSHPSEEAYTQVEDDVIARRGLSYFVWDGSVCEPTEHGTIDTS